MDVKILDDLKYASTHEWIKLDGDVATIGITDFAQHQLGDIVFVEFPELGESFEKGNEIGVIESAKAAGDIVIPMSGEIIENNEALTDNPELMNSSPYEDGWILKVKISNASELDALLSADDYKKIVQEESGD